MELNQVLNINKHTAGKEIDINMFLSQEGKHHKKEGWNKLSRTMKLNLLNTYADNYGKTDKLTVEDIKQLKLFLRKNKYKQVSILVKLAVKGVKESLKNQIKKTEIVRFFILTNFYFRCKIKIIM